MWAFEFISVIGGGGTVGSHMHCSGLMAAVLGACRARPSFVIKYLVTNVMHKVDEVVCSMPPFLLSTVAMPEAFCPFVVD